MRKHAAKKIVKRITEDPSAAAKYSFPQLRTAYQVITGEDVPADVWKARSDAIMKEKLAASPSRVPEHVDLQEGVARTTKQIAEGLKVPEELLDGKHATTPTTDYASMTVPDLKALCRERGITGYSKLNKGDLVEALTGSEE